MIRNLKIFTEALTVWAWNTLVMAIEDFFRENEIEYEKTYTSIEKPPMSYMVVNFKLSTVDPNDWIDDIKDLLKDVKFTEIGRQDVEKFLDITVKDNSLVIHEKYQ